MREPDERWTGARRAGVVAAMVLAGCSVDLLRGEDASGGSASTSTSVATTVGETVSTGGTSEASSGGEGGAADGGAGPGGQGGQSGQGGACGGAGELCCGGDTCANETLSCDEASGTCRGCVVAVAGGHAATGFCATTITGDLRCWGSNAYRQISCDAVGSSLPVRPETLVQGFVPHAVGYNTCGIAKGTVVCWGSNDFGECARTPSAPLCVGVPIGDLPGPARDVAVTLWGTTHALVGTEVWAWGNDAYGQISGVVGSGDGLPPTAVESLDFDNDAIAAGAIATCALKADGSVTCIGDNERFGLGSSDPDAAGPLSVLVDSVDELVAGEAFFCARVEGTVLCWGDNRSAQVSYGLPDERVALPEVVDVGGEARQITAGAVHACALLQDERVVCWGDNLKRQSGACDGDAVVMPTVVLDDAGEPLLAKRITAGSYTTCAIDLDDRVRCWGLDGEKQAGVPYEDDFACPPVTAEIACAAR